MEGITIDSISYEVPLMQEDYCYSDQTEKLDQILLQSDGKSTVFPMLKKINNGGVRE
jgi:hypothetical protein